MQYLFDHYGEGFMSALHREDLNGLAGLDAVLDQFGSRKSAMRHLHDWAAMMALDGAIDRSHRLRGGSIRWLTANTLSSKINWDTAQAYSTPGAPPNGSDYVRLRDANGRYLSADQIRTIRFVGPRPWSRRRSNGPSRRPLRTPRPATPRVPRSRPGPAQPRSTAVVAATWTAPSCRRSTFRLPADS